MSIVDELIALYRQSNLPQPADFELNLRQSIMGSKKTAEREHATDPIGAALRYIEDIKTATAPGALKELPGFLKEKLTEPREAVGWLQEVKEQYPKLGTALDVFGNVLNMAGVSGGNPLEIMDPTKLGAAASALRKGARVPAGKFGSEAFGGMLEAAAPDVAKKAIVTPPTLARSTLDEMTARTVVARERPAIETLAIRAQGGPIAETVMNNKARSDMLYRKAIGQTDLDVPEVLIPDPVTYTPDPRLVFQPRKMHLANYYLGTPVSAIARTRNMQAYKIAAEQALVEHSIDARVAKKLKAYDDSVAGILPEEQAYVFRKLDEVQGGNLKLDEALSQMTPPQQQLALSQRGKFDEYRGLIVQRLRDTLRPSVERKIRKAGDEIEVATTGKRAPGEEPFFQEIIERDIQRKVDEAVEKRIKDTWGIDDYMAHISPGEYLIIDKHGNRLAEPSRTIAERNMKIEELVADGMDVADIRTKSSIFMDSDSLGKWNKRRTQVFADFAKSQELTTEEIAAIAQGQWGRKGSTKFFGNLLKRTGAVGYTDDLRLINEIYDKRFERWVQLTELSKRSAPALERLEARGYTAEARMLKANMDALWGYRSDLSVLVDNSLQATHLPIASHAVERWGGLGKTALVAAMLKYKPQFHLANSTQLLTTLWPIATAKEIATGVRMFVSKEGRELIRTYGGYGSRAGSSLGPIENFNQGVAFLTMFDRAKRLGLDAQQAADFAFLRGNLYSQFHSIMVDRPLVFRKYDPSGMLSMFQRFGVKQIEQGIDLLKDRDVSGAAKWLGAIGLMGGRKALMGGGGGYLGLKAYQAIKDEYGEDIANIYHYGLPGLFGVDMSATATAFNPPWGDSLAEKVGNQLGGPVGSFATSIFGAALDTKAIEPSVRKRMIDAAITKLPIAREFDAIRRLMVDDYDMKNARGQLRYKADVIDLAKIAGGFKPVGKLDADQSTFSSLELWADAALDIRKKWDDVVDYAASRIGQARLSGMDLSEEMTQAIIDDVDKWNALWGNEMPITNSDIMNRARRRVEDAQRSLGERLGRSLGKRTTQNPALHGIDIQRLEQQAGPEPANEGDRILTDTLMDEALRPTY